MSRIYEALRRSVQEKKTSGTRPSWPQLLKELTPSVAELKQVRTEHAHPHSEARLVTVRDPESLEAQKYCVLGSRLVPLARKKNFKSFLVTSAVAREGKSITAANLAVVLAREQKSKVLLVDADLRRSSLSRILGVSTRSGLSEFLQGQADLLNLIRRLTPSGLYYLSSGLAPHNPVELLQSSAWGNLLAEARNQFDWILVDSPPLTPLADTLPLAQTVDGILLVVRAGFTPEPALRDVLQMVDQPRLIGVVLNGAQDPNHGYYYSQYRQSSKGIGKEESRSGPGIGLQE